MTGIRLLVEELFGDASLVAGFVAESQIVSQWTEFQ